MAQENTNTSSCRCAHPYDGWGHVDPRDLKAFAEGRAVIGGWRSQYAIEKEQIIRGGKTEAVAV